MVVRFMYIIYIHLYIIICKYIYIYTYFDNIHLHFCSEDFLFQESINQIDGTNATTFPQKIHGYLMTLV